MPRPLRSNNYGTVYHLISRFVAHEWFIREEEERRQYLHLLGVAMRQSDWSCLAYGVMSNHIHLAMVAGHDPLASWVRLVHAPFAEWMNRRRGRIGAVFARGPSDHGVHPQAVAKLIAYIHNNPVRAKVVAHAADSDWTSHRAYLGLSSRPEWLNIDEGFARAGFANPRDFDDWVSTAPADRADLDQSVLKRELRRRGSLRAGTPVIEDEAAPRTTPLFAKPWTHVRMDPSAIVRSTADVMGMSVVELCSRQRRPRVVTGRRVAVRAALTLGLSGTDIALALAISEQAVSTIRRRAVDAAVRDASRRVIELLSSGSGACPP